MKKRILSLLLALLLILGMAPSAFAEPDERTAEQKLADDRNLIETSDWTSAQAEANDEEALRAFIEARLALLELSGIPAVTAVSVTPAAAGTEDNASGTDGSYGFTAVLSLDGAGDTASVTGAVITAEPYRAPAPEPPTYEEAMESVRDYVRTAVPDPKVGSTGGEWAVFALNRGGAAGEEWNERYLANLRTYADDCGGKLHDRKYTEYSRVVIALTSMGVDASRFETDSAVYDFVTPLLDRQADGKYRAVWQGNNGTAFALLALDSRGYLNGDEGREARTAFIASLIAAQNADGALSINGNGSDLDTTAAAVYALAPYYFSEERFAALGDGVSRDEIKSAVDAALSFLAGAQGPDGGFGSAEADTWVVIALSAMGRDADADEAFIKNGRSVLDDMLSYFDAESGGFRHDKDGKVNKMASEQAAYGLTAYDRYKRGVTALYDMSDVELNTDTPYTPPVPEDPTPEDPDGGGSGAGGTVTGKTTVTVTMRLIGAEQAEKDVDLGAEAYLPDYVTWIPTAEYTLEKGATVRDLWVKATGDAGIASVGADNNYVETVRSPEGYELSEFSNGKRSGWMYTVNGSHPALGLAEQELHDGDTVIWHYVNDFSYEVSDWFSEGRWPSLGDGSYYDRWLAAPDNYMGRGGGTGTGTADGGGSGAGETVTEKTTVTVTMRLIGAEQAEKDVDLGAEAYLPDYVTWIPTAEYTLEKGATVRDLWVKATGDAGIASVGADRNYVETVRSPEGYELSEFSNGKRSGWMYTVDGSHPGLGLAEQELHDGDTVIWHYVNDFSYEVSDWVGEGRWPSLGDGSYYDGWLRAPDTYLGRGGGTGTADRDGGGSGEPEHDSGEASVTVTADAENGGAEVSAETISEALKSGAVGKMLTVSVEAGGADAVTAALGADAVKAAAEAGVVLKVDTGKAAVRLDARVLKAASESGGGVELSVIYNEDGGAVFDVKTGGERVDAKLRIELPSGDGNEIPVVVKADGTGEAVKKSFAEDGRCFAEIPAGAEVRFEKREAAFDDVKDGDGFAGDVSFVVGRGIFKGVSETEFAPEMPMNRAMLAAVLYRLEDAEASGENPFGDVQEGKWYADAVVWASGAGIVKGTGAGFEPEKNVEREQLAAMLHRYVRFLGLEPEGTADLSLFDDGGDISAWAREDVAWAVGVGLLNGGGRFEPHGCVTRAEAAEILARLVKLIVA